MPATPEEAVYQALAGNAAVNDAVGGRITQQVNTQEPELPLILFKRLGGAPSPTLNGVGGLARYVFVVDVWAETAADAASVTEAVEDAIFPGGGWRDPARGVLGAFPDDTSVELDDTPWRQWTRVFGLWFQPTS